MTRAKMPPLIHPEDDDDIESISSHTFSDSVLSSLSKRRRSAAPINSGDPDASDTETDTDSVALLQRSQRPTKVARRTLSHVAVTEQAYPRSAYEGWQAPMARSLEVTAIADLQTAHDQIYGNTDEPPEFTYFQLNDFTMYNPQNSRHAGEMVTLDRLQKGSYTEFLFDGVLSVGDRQHFVQGVRFRIMTVDGYGEPDVISIRNRICIQSAQAQRHEVWYQLGKPSPVYRRFHEPFLWLAQFAKFFVDYLLEMDQVTLNDFRSRFSQWLVRTYAGNLGLESWLTQCNNMTDYRTAIAAHVAYLWKECFSIDDRKTGLCKHPIWGEVNPYDLSAIPEQSNREQKTIVTPFVYKMFKRMYFREHMEVRQVLDTSILDKIATRKNTLGLTPFDTSQAPEAFMPTPQSLSHGDDNSIDVRIGDVVCVPPEIDGAWRLTCSTWYAYVQNIRQQPLRTLLDVIWLYEPHDTTFGKAYYPFKNELFMSDNCGCGKDAVNLSEVTGKVDVTWFAKDPSQHSGLFVRQKFRTIKDEDTYDFVSLQESDFNCSCSVKVPIFEDCRSKYRLGDAVLVKQWNSDQREDILEPAQIVNFDLDSRRVKLRRLVRQRRIEDNAAPNELVLSDETFQKPPSAIIRKCHIRTFTSAQVRKGLPTPYDRRGACDFFYIIAEGESSDVDRYDMVEDDETQDNTVQVSTREHSSDRIRFPPLESGLDLSRPSRNSKLRGMGIFCGGGNFDRGLEDGGAVEFKYAVDWAERAIHSYRANVENPSSVQFFRGSVNDYLAKAIAGSNDQLIANVGEVCLLSAGSPCPGFSTLQLNKQSTQSLRNASMVASVVSYVDFYCPKYLVLENVVSMTHGMGRSKDENVFAQILAALVAMGYQTQQFLMDAWNYRSSQSRSRVFIIASAPGLKPLKHPQHSHDHPAGMSVKALGKSSNRLPFGVRRFDYTSFQHLSPTEATKDLPDIGDSQPQLCPAYPDHRTPSEEVANCRARIAAVPVRPYGMGIAQAALQGRLSGEPLEWFERQSVVRKQPGSKPYSRVVPTGLFRTVTTALNIQCGISGSTLHWNQDRSLTVMELKRAQGFLDQDVIIGTPRHQVHIIGNSVERNVALALGLALRESWANGNQRDNSTPAPDTSSDLSQSASKLQPSPAFSEVARDTAPTLRLSPAADASSNSWQSTLDLHTSAIASEAAPDTAPASHPSSQRKGRRSALSEHERDEIRGDPSHGFQIINRIFAQRDYDIPLRSSSISSAGSREIEPNDV